MKVPDPLEPQMLRIHRRMSALMRMRKPPVADVVAVYHEWRILMELPEPTDRSVEDTAFAALHKARCQVSWATKEQRRESRRWLRDHGFEVPAIPFIHT